jgi:hypothetical protein
LFESTGTSNEYGFAGVYFPTAGLHESYHKHGWITKFIAVHEQAHPALYGRFCQLYDELEMGASRTCAKELHGFLRYFATWFQVQQSAALGGEFWLRPDLRFLYDLAIHFRFDGSDFVELPDAQVVRSYVLPSDYQRLRHRRLSDDMCDTITLEEAKRASEDEGHDRIVATNDWLKQHDALIARTAMEWFGFVDQRTKDR